MNTWADLHGEHEWSFSSKPSRNAKWCDNCQCWVEWQDRKRFSPDGSIVHFLCSGCDAELWEPEQVDE